MDFGPYLLLATLEGLVQAATLALMALGLSLVFGVMRVVNVAHGSFYMLGAIVTWWVATRIGVDLGLGPQAGFIAALIFAPIAVGVVAFAADRAVLSPLKYDPDSTIVATIGLLYILEQTALLTFGPDARSIAPPFSMRVQLPWFGYSGYKLFVIAAAFVLVAAVWLAMSRSRWGLILRATQINREMALAFGIPVKRVYGLVFAAGAGLAAMAAVLIVPIQQAHYLMGGDPLLLSFIVVILGGLGSLRGTLIAAILIGVADGIVSVFFSPVLAKILATLLVAMVLVVRPNGLFGRQVS